MLAIVATIGVGWFVFAARVAPRTVEASSLANPALNFAYVRVAGTVIAYPGIDASTGTLTLALRDRTGDIRLSAFRGVGQTLLQTLAVPMPGDFVTVDGTVRIRDDEPMITVNDAAAISISSPVATDIQLAGIDASRLGDRVRLAGQVRRVRDVGVVRIVSLRDGNATTDMLMPLSLAAMFGKPQDLRTGEWISATGAVGEFRDRKQLLTTRAENVRVLPLAREWDLRPITALTRDLAGSWVAVQGTVREVRTTGGATRIQIVDSQANGLTISLFDIWQLVPFSATLKAGEIIAVQGQLIEARNGALELRPELAGDLALR